MSDEKIKSYKSLPIISFFAFSRIFSLFSLFLAGVISSRILGPEARGIYSLFFTTCGLALNFSNIGLSQSNTFFSNKFNNVNSKLFSNAIFYASTLLFIGIGVNFFLSYMKINDPKFIFLLDNRYFILLFLIGTLLEASFNGLILGNHEVNYLSKTQNLNSIFLIIASSSIIIYPENIKFAIYVRIFFYLIFILLLTFNLILKFKISINSIDFKLLKSQIKFGSKNWLQNLIGLLNHKGNIFLMAAFSSSKELGFYSVSLLFIEFVRFIPDTTGTLLLSRLMIKNSGNNIKLTAKLCRLVLSIITLVGILLIIYSKFILSLMFGEKYFSALISLKIMIIGGIAISLHQILTRYFTSESKQLFSIISSSIGMIISFLISVLLIPELGSLGGAISFLIGNISTSILMVYFVCNKNSMRFSDFIFIRKDDFKILKNTFLKLNNKNEI